MKSHEKRIVTVMVILTISLALLLSICRKIAKEPKYDYSKDEFYLNTQVKESEE